MSFLKVLIFLVHYFFPRKTGIDGSMSSGVPGSYVSMMFGQKNLASKISYMSQTDATQKATNIVLQNVVSGEASSSPLFKDIYDGERKNKSKPEELTFTSPSNNLESTNDAPSCSSSKKKKKKKRKEKVETSSSSSSSDTDSSDDEKSKKKLKKLRKKIKKLEQMKQPTFPQPGYPQPSFPQPGYPQPSFPQPSYPQPGYPQPSYPYAVQMMPPPYQMVHILPNNYPQAEAVKLPQQQVLTRTLTQTQTLGPANNNYLVDEIDNRN